MDLDMLGFAGMKLTTGRDFDKNNRDMVFALLSQRICLEHVVNDEQANAPAATGTSSHMRILTDDRT